MLLLLALLSLLAPEHPRVSKRQLQKEISRLIGKIPEFAALDKAARKRGGRVWLFGGSAATFAHYAKESLLAHPGRNKIGENTPREIDYADIFRPTQDLDLVAEGGTEVAFALEDEVDRMGYLKGTRGGQWDIRSLRVAHNGKGPLLGDFGFANQHTDSHSVGMIRLGDGEVRDLLHWDARRPPFLGDVAKGKLGFIFQQAHRQTPRYREGMNPEILSVIRYLIKLSQHRLSPLAKDLETVKGIVEDFNPAAVQGYVRYWMEVNVPKLFLHSQDVERSWNILEETGLREKLLKIGHPDQEGSPAWWAAKEPLRSYPVGLGEGKTAGELGIHTLIHDTQDFLLWTVITRSSNGHPNVFISRKNVSGERALSGPGHYTIANRKVGAGGTGFSVRYRLDPMAREESDFNRYGEMVLVLNKSAIRILPENVSMAGVLAYFELVAANGRYGMAGLREQLKRKLLSLYTTDTGEDRIVDILRLLAREEREDLWKEWFSLPLSAKYPETLQPMIKSKGEFLAKDVFPEEHWAAHPELLRAVIEQGDQEVLQNLALYTFPEEHWAAHPELLRTVIEKGDQDVLRSLAIYTFSKDHWAAHPELLRAVIEKGNQEVLRNLAVFAFTKEVLNEHPELLRAIVEKGDQDILQILKRTDCQALLSASVG